MSVKRVALLVLVCVFVYGFSVHSVSASANTGAVAEDTAEGVAVTATPDLVAEPAAAKEAEAPKATGTPKATVAPKATGTPKATVAPKSTKAPKATAAPKSTKAPKATAAPKSTKIPKKTTDTKKKTTKKLPYTKAELRLMASIINCEAGGECYQGKLAVGIVVMNRVKSSAFPNTVKGVIYEKFQFSPVRNGSLKRRLSEYDHGKISSAQWKSCISAAKKTLSGQNTIIRKGKVRSMKGIHFFSVGLSGAKFKLGGHRFK